MQPSLGTAGLVISWALKWKFALSCDCIKVFQQILTTSDIKSIFSSSELPNSVRPKQSFRLFVHAEKAAEVNYFSFCRFSYLAREFNWWKMVLMFIEAHHVLMNSVDYPKIHGLNKSLETKQSWAMVTNCDGRWTAHCVSRCPYQMRHVKWHSNRIRVEKRQNYIGRSFRKLSWAQNAMSAETGSGKYWKPINPNAAE